MKATYMPLLILIVFYLTIAALEILLPDRCLNIFERIIGNTKKIRLLGVAGFAIAFLYHIAMPSRLLWLIKILSWIYLASGIWFVTHPKSFVSLCHRGFLDMPPAEKRTVLYSDCAMRTFLGLLLIYSL